MHIHGGVPYFEKGLSLDLLLHGVVVALCNDNGI